MTTMQVVQPVQKKPFTSEHLKAWERDGVVVIENFFDKSEVVPVFDTFVAMYGDKGSAKHDDALLDGSRFKKQFEFIDILPYDSGIDLNLISLHPHLMSLARALLKEETVHLYQSHTWAKFTGATNYNQAFHCDFNNHTLTVPSTQLGLSTVNFLIYISDVDADLGAFEYVPRPDSTRILGSRVIQISENYKARQSELSEYAKLVEAPAGSLIVYGLDVFHRGTNLVRSEGCRYSMTVSYKKSGNDAIGFHVWQSKKESNWSLIFEFATPHQLNCLGVPLPGDEFWNKTTISQTLKRWPNWNSEPYTLALER